MGEEESSSVCKTASGEFRWLCLARFAVALVVTVLATLVLVWGLNLVLRPRAVELNIARSNVYVSKGTNYSFRFYLEATNPSKVVFVYYRNITVQLFVPPRPWNHPFAEFNLTPSSLFLSQKDEQEYLVSSDHIYQFVDVEKLFPPEGGERNISGAAMVLSGDVTVDNLKHGSTVSFPVTFKCEPVDIKSDAELPKPSSGNYKANCLPTHSS